MVKQLIDWLIDWLVFYAAFNSISVISRRQLTLFMLSWVSPVLGTAGNHVTQQQKEWPTFEEIPPFQVRKSSIIPLIRDRLEFGLKQRRRKDSGDLLDVLDFLNNTW